MDTRTEFISSIVSAMQHDLDQDQLQKLSDLLYIKLDKYELSERCTELAPVDGTPEKLLKRFVATKRLEGKSEKTIAQYSRCCEHLIGSLGKQLDQVTTYDLRFYLAAYQEKHNISNRSLENTRRYIGSFFGWLYKEALIPSNPAAALDSIKYEKQVRKPFTAEELEKIRRSCKTARDRAIVELLYSTGCRVSEVEQLNRNDIDFLHKQAVVLGKGNKQRTVYLTNSCILYLQEYIENRLDFAPCLFLNKQGGRLSKSGIEDMLHKLEKPSGVSDIHPHRFRRTLATNMIARGAAIQDVSIILGHEDISTTQIYCSVSQEDVAYTYHKCIA